jgi:uncharacterized repeat protein (TIGR01451 family)
VAPGDPITYTIDFENVPTATAPAQTVTITDQLDPNLDLSTLQLSSIGFNHVFIPIQPGIQSFQTNATVATDLNPVRVTASLDPTNGVLTWLMASIDPVTDELVADPLAGFLPPDNAQRDGQGFVVFTIRPKAGLATGTQIYNQAVIVFDVNAPMATDVTTNILDATPPTSTMTALPAISTSPNLLVSWSGSDTGSGVANFDIYVSMDHGLWTPWLLGTTNTSAIYQAITNHAYTFYSVAFDAVGNQEASPTVPGASAIVTLITNQPVVRLDWPARSSDGRLKFRLIGPDGQWCVIQASTNLSYWLNVQTNQLNGGFYDFTEPYPSLSLQRYFRAWVLP